VAHVGQIRVLIADDHTMVRQALGNALQAFPSIEVVAKAGDGDEAVVATAASAEGCRDGCQQGEDGRYHGDSCN
jgi:hypothetical protein